MTMNIDTMKMYEQCKKYIHSYVLVETADRMSYDGIVTGLDDEYVYLAVPNDAYEPNSTYRMNDQQRVFGYPGFGPYSPRSGYEDFPPRRFRRVVLPLAALSTLSLLAWY